MWSVKKGDELVYGTPGGGDDGVFVPVAEAKRLVVLQRALRTATTWGELRAAVDADDLAEIIERSRFDEDEVEAATADDAGFNSGIIWGYDDGDWPDWPAARMDEWMPSAVADEYLAEIPTLLNGSYFAIAVADLAVVVKRLRALGYPCRRDDDLVGFVSGYNVPGYPGK